MGLEVQFGKKTYEVQPQRVGRIRRKLGSALSLVQDAAGGESPDSVGTQLYEGLRVFVPDLAPEWELGGYMSKEDFDHRDDPDWEEQPYEAERDGSPLTTEIEAMMNAVFTINGGDRLVRLLGKFIDESTVKRQIRIWQTQAVQKKVSSDSPSSPRRNGASVPLSSSTTPSSVPTETQTPA
jgi:hypothetical protein